MTLISVMINFLLIKQINKDSTFFFLNFVIYCAMEL